MLKIAPALLILFIVFSIDGHAQKRRPDKTSGGKAAYGVATVKSNGKIKKAKKGKKEKPSRRKKRKSTPSFRKTQNWAG